MCDDKGNIIEERSDIIKPEGFSIPVEASRVHGITTIKAQEEGQDLLSTLELFSDKIDVAYALICLLYTSPSPRDLSTSRMPSSA